MRRRAFLGQCIALGAAPMIVRASSLMPVANPWWVGIDLSTNPAVIVAIRWQLEDVARIFNVPMHSILPYAF